jgi:hypothetical protein
MFTDGLTALLDAAAGCGCMVSTAEAVASGAQLNVAALQPPPAGNASAGAATSAAGTATSLPPFYAYEQGARLFVEVAVVPSYLTPLGADLTPGGAAAAAQGSTAQAGRDVVVLSGTGNATIHLPSAEVAETAAAVDLVSSAAALAASGAQRTLAAGPSAAYFSAAMSLRDALRGNGGGLDAESAAGLIPTSLLLPAVSNGSAGVAAALGDPAAAEAALAWPGVLQPGVGAVAARSVLASRQLASLQAAAASLQDAGAVGSASIVAAAEALQLPYGGGTAFAVAGVRGSFLVQLTDADGTSTGFPGLAAFLSSAAAGAALNTTVSIPTSTTVAQQQQAPFTLQLQYASPLAGQRGVGGVEFTPYTPDGLGVAAAAAYGGRVQRVSNGAGPVRVGAGSVALAAATEPAYSLPLPSSATAAFNATPVLSLADAVLSLAAASNAAVSAPASASRPLAHWWRVDYAVYASGSYRLQLGSRAAASDSGGIATVVDPPTPLLQPAVTLAVHPAPADAGASTLEYHSAPGVDDTLALRQAFSAACSRDTAALVRDAAEALLPGQGAAPSAAVAALLDAIAAGASRAAPVLAYPLPSASLLHLRTHGSALAAAALTHAGAALPLPAAVPLALVPRPLTFHPLPRGLVSRLAYTYAAPEHAAAEVRGSVAAAEAVAAMRSEGSALPESPGWALGSQYAALAAAALAANESASGMGTRQPPAEVVAAAQLSLLATDLLARAASAGSVEALLQRYLQTVSSAAAQGIGSAADGGVGDRAASRRLLLQLQQYAANGTSTLAAAAGNATAAELAQLTAAEAAVQMALLQRWLDVYAAGASDDDSSGYSATALQLSVSLLHAKPQQLQLPGVSSGLQPNASAPPSFVCEESSAAADSAAAVDALLAALLPGAGTSAVGSAALVSRASRLQDYAAQAAAALYPQAPAINATLNLTASASPAQQQQALLYATPSVRLVLRDAHGNPRTSAGRAAVYAQLVPAAAQFAAGFGRLAGDSLSAAALAGNGMCPGAAAGAPPAEQALSGAAGSPALVLPHPAFSAAGRTLLAAVGGTSNGAAATCGSAGVLSHDGCVPLPLHFAATASISRSASGSAGATPLLSATAAAHGAAAFTASTTALRVWSLDERNGSLLLPLPRVSLTALAGSAASLAAAASVLGASSSGEAGSMAIHPAALPLVVPQLVTLTDGALVSSSTGEVATLGLASSDGGVASQPTMLLPHASVALSPAAATLEAARAATATDAASAIAAELRGAGATCRRAGSVTLNSSAPGTADATPPLSPAAASYSLFTGSPASAGTGAAPSPRVGVPFLLEVRMPRDPVGSGLTERLFPSWGFRPLFSLPCAASLGVVSPGGDAGSTAGGALSVAVPGATRLVGSLNASALWGSARTSQFSAAVWSGWLRTPADAEYTLQLACDGPCELLLDGRLLIAGVPANSAAAANACAIASRAAAAAPSACAAPSDGVYSARISLRGSQLYAVSAVLLRQQGSAVPAAGSLLLQPSGQMQLSWSWRPDPRAPLPSGSEATVAAEPPSPSAPDDPSPVLAAARQLLDGSDAAFEALYLGSDSPAPEAVSPRSPSAAAGTVPMHIIPPSALYPDEPGSLLPVRGSPVPVLLKV